jgi:hypothetical protein
MKSKLFALISLLVANQAIALNSDPESPFNTSNNYTNQSTITWRTEDNVQKACEDESRKRGHKGFGFGVQACSFFHNNTCTIITGKQATMHILGHEVRHCFQGNWH